MILRFFFFFPHKQVLKFCALGILLDFEGQIFASIGCDVKHKLLPSPFYERAMV